MIKLCKRKQQKKTKRHFYAREINTSIERLTWVNTNRPENNLAQIDLKGLSCEETRSTST